MARSQHLRQYYDEGGLLAQCLRPGLHSLHYDAHLFVVDRSGQPIQSGLELVIPAAIRRLEPVHHLHAHVHALNDD